MCHIAEMRRIEIQSNDASGYREVDISRENKRNNLFRYTDCILQRKGCVPNVPPASRDVVELVKCGCKGECKGNCSCANNGLACTPLCKCYAAGCSKHKDYHRDDQDEDMEEEDLD